MQSALSCNTTQSHPDLLNINYTLSQTHLSLIRDFLILGNSVEIKQQYVGLINLRSNLINDLRSDVITEMPENAVHLMVAKRRSIPIDSNDKMSSFTAEIHNYSLLEKQIVFLLFHPYLQLICHRNTATSCRTTDPNRQDLQTSICGYM